ncbi:MAG: hypothetical protein NVS3B17_01010 [Vulcanimicrobiaceae bacterium]
MNDRTARTTRAPDALEAERTLHAREVLVDENDADDDAFVDNSSIRRWVEANASEGRHERARAHETDG